jgi:hypothetical protein
MKQHTRTIRGLLVAFRCKHSGHIEQKLGIAPKFMLHTTKPTQQMITVSMFTAATAAGLTTAALNDGINNLSDLRGRRVAVWNAREKEFKATGIVTVPVSVGRRVAWEAERWWGWCGRGCAPLCLESHARHPSPKLPPPPANPLPKNPTLQMPANTIDDERVMLNRLSSYDVDAIIMDSRWVSYYAGTRVRCCCGPLTARVFSLAPALPSPPAAYTNPHHPKTPQNTTT